MQALRCRPSAPRSACAARRCSRASRPTTVVCRAEEATTTGLNTKPAAAAVPVPEWLPEQAVPVLKFLTADDFQLKDSDLYKTYLQKYAENEWVVKSTGFKELPEIINGRAAMIGFVAGLGAEIFGAGSLVQQLGKFPQPVVLGLVLITVGSIVPIVKATEGNYLESLRDTYSIPEGVFTAPLERLHSRIAMLGVGGLVLIELLKGSALF